MRIWWCDAIWAETSAGAMPIAADSMAQRSMPSLSDERALSTAAALMSNVGSSMALASDSRASTMESASSARGGKGIVDSGG